MGAADDPDVPTHHRSIQLDVRDLPEELEVTARLRDERPWAAGTGVVEHVHDMSLVVRVRRSDLVIVDARAEMAGFPHAECRHIEDAFQDLVGSSVVRGYTRAVQERLGRARGCTHLELLARLVGPAVLQGAVSSHQRAQWAAADGPGGNGIGPGGDGSAPGAWLADTCHVWATEGPGPGYQKAALGWRPGVGEYPAPPVDELRRRARASDESPADEGLLGRPRPEPATGGSS